MSNHGTPDDDFTSVRARRESVVADLTDLRFIGEATADTLAAADITAELIRERGVSYLQLVELGVDPGVAARLRREYSLKWSREPTRGARLRRRAEQIQHLRDDERSWINASGGSEEPPRASRASPDGSGDSADAELAWRTRSLSGSPGERRSRPGVPPLDPQALTVAELEEALLTMDDPEAILAVRDAERDGKDRTTAIDAIERRLEALGADPEREASGGALQTPGSGATSMAAVADRVRLVVSELPEAEEIPSFTETVARIDTRTAPVRTALRRRVDDVTRRVARFEGRVRTTPAEDWRQLSLGLLVGLVAFGALATLVVAISSPTGSQLSVLSLFLVTVVVGVIALPLHWWGAVGGSELAMLAALVAMGSAALIAAVTPGAGSLATTPVALAVFGLIAAGLLTATFLSMPGR